MHSSIRHARGVTLIELVIVVGIVSILAAFAYPSYVERAQRAKRTDAKAALINIAGQQERFFFRCSSHQLLLADLLYCQQLKSPHEKLVRPSPHIRC